VTKKTYDAVGNVLQLVSPRAYDTSPDPNKADPNGGTFTDYVTSYSYDRDNRLIKTALPTSGAFPEQDFIYQKHDPDGYVSVTALPDPAGSLGAVPFTKKTTMTYFDPGWIKLSGECSKRRCVAPGYTR